VRRAVLGLACALAAAGCGATTGVRDEGPKVQEVVGGQAAPSQQVDVYFIRYGGPAAVQRLVAPSPSLARAALRALLEGPTAVERGKRFASAIPPGAKLANFTVQDGAASVDLVGPFEPIQQDKFADIGPGARRRQALLEEIVYTLTSFAEITNVQVSLNGEPISLVQTFEGASLTRDLFGVAAASFADSGACQPTGRLPRREAALRLIEPLPAGTSNDGFVRFRAVTTRKSGRVVAQLIQDGRVVRNLDRADMAFNQPGAANPAPCARFTGALEVPWGVTGAVTFRLMVRPGPSGGEDTVAERLITIEDAAPDA
jgi:hypothetical protein